MRSKSQVTVVYTVQIYCHEETNRHSGAMVFMLGHFLSSIPFVFLVSISSSLVFYYLIGLRNEFSLLMYFVVTIFMCLLANEALMMIVAYIWLETHKCTLTLACLYVSVCIAPFFLYACYCSIIQFNEGWRSTCFLFQVIMMLVAGYFRKRETLPYAVWTYPLSFISFHTYTVQVISCGYADFGMWWELYIWPGKEICRAWWKTSMWVHRLLWER